MGVELHCTDVVYLEQLERTVQLSAFFDFFRSERFAPAAFHALRVLLLKFKHDVGVFDRACTAETVDGDIEHTNRLGSIGLCCSLPRSFAHVYESVIGPDNFMGEAMWDTAAIVWMMGQAGTPTEPQELPLTRCTQPSKVGKERFQQEKTGTVRVSVGFVFPQLALGTLQVKVVS
eukprot:COSAG02_NODE_31624_length_530_cov_1.037123_1_plen_174_part_01